MDHDDAPAPNVARSRFAVLVQKSGRSERAAAVVADPTAFLATFRAASRAASSSDRQRLGELEQDLAAAFLLAPEAAELDSMSSYEQLLELGRVALGRTVFDLSEADVAMLLDDVFPHKVMLEAEDVGPLVADLRLFFAFLARAFDHAPAQAIAASLGDDAVRKLGGAVAQSATFTRERAILAEGTNAGFDMYTREGVEAYVAWKKARLASN
jgi:hypothetical protein